MPSRDTLERFIAQVESGAHAEAIEAFYTPDASMRENHAPPRRGRESLAENERRVLGRARAVTSTCLRPVFVDGDRVVVRWRFHFDWLDGTTSDIEELAYQRWEGERIADEQFFYDPQLARKPAFDERSPASVVQRQLDAYNAKDIDGLLATYAPDAVHATLQGVRLASGHDEMRARFVARFAEPDLHAQVLSRIVMGNVVVDHESIRRTFPEGPGTVQMVCIYEIVEGRIERAWFASGEQRLDAVAAGPAGARPTS